MARTPTQFEALDALLHDSKNATTYTSLEPLRKEFDDMLHSRSYSSHEEMANAVADFTRKMNEQGYSSFTPDEVKKTFDPSPYFARRTENPFSQQRPGLSLHDFVAGGKDEGHGGGHGVAEQNSLEKSVQEVQKQLILQKLTAAIEEYRGGKVDNKALLATLGEVVDGLSLDNLLQDQHALLRDIATNADFFKNKAADRQNILEQLHQTHQSTVQALVAQKQEAAQKDPKRFLYEQTLNNPAQRDKLVQDLFSSVQSSSRSKPSAISQVSSIISSQHNLLKPILPKRTQEMQTQLPPELFKYLADFLAQEATTWTGVIVQSGNGYHILEEDVFADEDEGYSRQGGGGGYESGGGSLIPQIPGSNLWKAGKKIKKAKGLLNTMQNADKARQTAQALQTGANAANAVGSTATAAGGAATTTVGTAGGASAPAWLPWVLLGIAILALLILIAVLVYKLVTDNGQTIQPVLTPSCSPSTDCIIKLKAMGINISGALALNGDPYGKAKVIYEDLALVTQPPSKFGTLLGLPQKHIDLVLHANGGCAGHASGTGRLDYYGWCRTEIVNKFMLLHELGHMIAFRNPSLYWKYYIFWIVLGPFRNMPTYNCLFDYGIGPYPAECWADAVAEYVYYPQYRVTVSGRPPGPYNFPTFPGFGFLSAFNGGFYYVFMKNDVYGGATYNK